MSQPYSGNVGEWHGSSPPTRTEALLLAARCAAAAGDPFVPAEAGVARAAQSRAWSAVAALAEDLEMVEISVSPAPRRDATVLVGKCQHQVPTIRIMPNGRWMHVVGLNECSAPPATAAEVGP